jgi:hypothetical protein
LEDNPNNAGPLKTSKTLAIALALGAAIGCSDSTEPIPPGTTLLTFNLCGDLVSLPFGWFAYRNEGGEWTKVNASSSGSFSFYATEKVSFALSLSFFGTSITEVIHTTAAELGAAGAMSCEDEFGTRAIGGSVTGLTGDQIVRLSGGSAFDVASVSDPNWQLTDLPTSQVDIVGTRYADFGTQPANRVAIRRGVFPNNATIPALDFGSATESANPETATVTFTGLGTSGSLDVGSAIQTANGTLHELMRFSTVVSGSLAVGYVSVPSPLRIASDLHLIDAFLSDADGTRTLQHYYAAPATKTFAFGPMIGTPTVSTVATSPYVMPRAQLASQPEYDGGLIVEWTQSTGDNSGKIVAVITTAAFTGGVPATWDVSVPNMSSAGYSPSWGLQGTGYRWSITAVSGAGTFSLNGAAPADGATLRTATRDEEFAMEPASRRQLPSLMRRLIPSTRLPR